MITMGQLFPELTPTEQNKSRLKIVNEWAKIKYEAGQYDSLEAAEKHTIRAFRRTWEYWDTGIMPHKDKY